MAADRRRCHSELGRDGLQGRALGEKREDLALAWREKPLGPAFGRTRTAHEVEEDGLLPAPDGDRREGEQAAPAARPDEEPPLGHRPAFAGVASGEAAGVAHGRPALVDAAQHLPAGPADGLLGRDPRQLLCRPVPGQDLELLVECEEGIAGAKFVGLGVHAASVDPASLARIRGRPDAVAGNPQRGSAVARMRRAGRRRTIRSMSRTTWRHERFVAMEE